MKKITARMYTPAIIFCAGLAGAAARGIFCHLGPDAAGLMPRNHPLEIFCVLLTAAVVIGIAPVIKDAPGGNGFYASLSGGKFTLPLSILAAAGILSGLACQQQDSYLFPLRILLGLLGSAGLILAAVSRSRGKRVRPICYGVLCLFYLVYMVCSYQDWSANPQLTDYVWQLLASGAMAICAYQRTALCAGLGHRRRFLFSSLLAGYLCLLAFPGTQQWFMYLTGGICFLGDTSLFPGRPPQMPENREEG